MGCIPLCIRYSLFLLCLPLPFYSRHTQSKYIKMGYDLPLESKYKQLPPLSFSSLSILPSILPSIPYFFFFYSFLGTFSRFFIQTTKRYPISLISSPSKPTSPIHPSTAFTYPNTEQLSVHGNTAKPKMTSQHNEVKENKEHKATTKTKECACALFLYCHPSPTPQSSQLTN
ncbi:MAG: hypothetical protein BYD32DRAFT_148352 [Podila humilis]|nr:MAG: hypothetical protein BYD32DRAFT_148352 [Podila humilis]